MLRQFIQPPWILRKLAAFFGWLSRWAESMRWKCVYYEQRRGVNICQQ